MSVSADKITVDDAKKDIEVIYPEPVDRIAELEKRIEALEALLSTRPNLNNDKD